MQAGLLDALRLGNEDGRGRLVMISLGFESDLDLLHQFLFQFYLLNRRHEDRTCPRHRVRTAGKLNIVRKRRLLNSRTRLARPHTYG